MMQAFRSTLAACALAACTLAAGQQKILGTKPAYLGEISAAFPNHQAVTPRIWAPGLADGWTPQGLVIAGSHALVSSYRDSEPKCRVFRIELATGTDAGSFGIPEPCQHAGGLADIGGGWLIVADTRQDWRVDVAKALASGEAAGATRGMIKLGPGFGSAFTAFDGKDLWNGVYTVTANAADAKVYRLELGVFDRLDGQTLPRDAIHDIVQIPPLAQGAAFDRNGNLWLSASNSKIGKLYRVDRKTGAVQVQYDVMPGIEGISFDADGQLWGISEAGARKYMGWRDHYPLIFQIDVAKLK